MVIWKNKNIFCFIFRWTWTKTRQGRRMFVQWNPKIISSTSDLIFWRFYNEILEWFELSAVSLLYKINQFKFILHILQWFYSMIEKRGNIVCLTPAPRGMCPSRLWVSGWVWICNMKTQIFYFTQSLCHLHTISRCLTWPELWHLNLLNISCHREWQWPQNIFSVLYSPETLYKLTPNVQEPLNLS